MPLGNRTYQRDTRQNQWVSYEHAKYALRDSNYQFENPSQWFAETHSRYFKPPMNTWGTRVNDPAARAWFHTNLDPNAPGGAALLNNQLLQQIAVSTSSRRRRGSSRSRSTTR